MIIYQSGAKIDDRIDSIIGALSLNQICQLKNLVLLLVAQSLAKNIRQNIRLLGFHDPRQFVEGDAFFDER